MSIFPAHQPKIKVKLRIATKTKVLVAIMSIVVLFGGFIAVTEYKIQNAKRTTLLFRFPIEERLSPEAVLTLTWRIKESNQRLEQLNVQYKNAKQKQKARLLPQMEKFAEMRSQLLRTLIVNDPQKVNEVTLAFRRSEFPLGVQRFLEEPFDTEGLLEVWHGDHFEKRVSSNVYTLNLEGKKLFVFSSVIPHNLISRVRVKASGSRLGSYLAAMTLQIIKLEPTLLLRDVEERLAVILLQYRNTPGSETFPNALEEINRKVFGDGPGNLAGFYREDSYGRVRMSGTALWVQLPEDWEYYFDSGMTVDEFRQIVVDATDPYLDWPQYSRIIVIEHFDPVCTGGGSSIGKVDLQSTEGAFQASFAELYSMRCVDPPRLYLAHELGHGFGMKHAGTWNCEEIVGENLETPEESCVIDGYGDRWDVMGRSIQHTSVFHKETVGWLSSSQSVTVDVANGETYRITPNEISDRSSVKQLKIPLEFGWYSLEYRKRPAAPEIEYEGFEAVLLRYVPNEVMLAPGGSVDTLWPVDPATGIGLVLKPYGNLFHDRFRNIYVQVLRTAENHAVVYVGSTPPILPDLRVYDLVFESVTNSTVRAIARIINNTCGPLSPPYVCPTSEVGPANDMFSIKFQRILADGTTVDDGVFSSSDLEPGQMSEVEGPVYDLEYFSEGVTLRIEIDSDNTIVESREDNNVFTAPRPKPDLVIAQPIESTTLADGSLTLSAMIKNVGMFPVTAPFTVGFYKVFSSGMVEIGVVSQDELLINQEVLVTSSAISRDVQRETPDFAVIADSGSVISELNEDNNTRRFPELRITPPSIPGGGGF